MEQQQQFGQYMVGRTVGRGTFAKVKEATHIKTRTKVALKVIPRRVVDEDPKSQVKIRREIRILQMLRHPHVMRLYDVVQTRHDIILALEYVSGGELFDYISKNGRLSEAVARRFFQQLVTAVYHCHLYSVAHRDIKPENIMLDSAHQMIKVGDFGLSSIMRDGKLFETSCGTPNYAAPEVVSGRVYNGREADVWSCGVVLFTMLAGNLPFDENVPHHLFQKICSGTYTCPRFFGSEVTNLIGQMLIVDPLKRITMQQVLENRWVREQFPDYLVRTTTQSLYDSKQFADSNRGDVRLHADIIEELARVHHKTTEEIEAIAIRNEFDNSETLQRRAQSIASSAFYKEANSVVDDLVQPLPLIIPSADDKLRSETHEIWVSYNIMLDRKLKSQGGGGDYNRSDGGSSNSLLVRHFDPMASSASGSTGLLEIGSLRGRSLGPQTHLSYNNHAAQTTGGGLQRVQPGTMHMSRMYESPAEGSGSFPNRGRSTFVDVFLDGYNATGPVQPLLLHSGRNGATGTVLGKLFGLRETVLSSASNDGLIPPPPTTATTGDSDDAPRRLLVPRRATDEEGGPTQPNPAGLTDTRSHFGNDFMRNGVVLSGSAPLALEIVMSVLTRCGFTYRAGTAPFVLSAVRHPSTKLILKLYKVATESFLVDVRVSTQCGFVGIEGALEVLQELDAQRINRRRK